MKNLLILAAVAAFAVPRISSAADVGISINVGEPGFYGRIDIGTFPRPQLVYAQPVIIQPVAVVTPPLYLHVPPGHVKKWGKHCHKYNACGQPVYFVQDTWYNDVYVPAYYERNRKHDRRDWDDDHDDDHDHGHDQHRGRGRGHDDD